MVGHGKGPKDGQVIDDEMALYEVAYHLHMPVYMMKKDMPYDEMLKWLAYFERRPVGWRDDDRMFKLISTVRGIMGGKPGKPEEMFGTLEPIYRKPAYTVPKGEADLSTLKGSFLHQRLLSAKGGVKLNAN